MPALGDGPHQHKRAAAHDTQAGASAFPDEDHKLGPGDGSYRIAGLAGENPCAVLDPASSSEAAVVEESGVRGEGAAPLPRPALASPGGDTLLEVFEDLRGNRSGVEGGETGGAGSLGNAHPGQGSAAAATYTRWAAGLNNL